jgi:ribosomal protein S18 acetylase RimI-like enzyme
MLHRDVAWRALTGYDLAAVEAIAAEVHPDLFESPEVLAERQRLYHNGCYLLEIGARPVGYVLSHPWRSETLPALNARLGAIPAEADTYYLHDLAVLPVARRVGAASHIVKALFKHAAALGFPTMHLVAVAGSQGFWKKHGFAAAAISDDDPKLGSYGSGAQPMVRVLSQHPPPDAGGP